MISFNKFKELFDKLEVKRQPEIEIYFDDTCYILIKYENYITFGKENADIGEIKSFSNLDELYDNFF